jgi:hypothetical protein
VTEASFIHVGSMRTTHIRQLLIVVDMLAAPAGDIGTSSIPEINAALFNWHWHLMATEEVALLWCLAGVETLWIGSRKTARGISTLSRRQHIYQATRRRILDGSLNTTSLAGTLASAAFTENAFGNRKASEIHRRALVSVALSQGLQNTRKDRVWHLLIINILVGLGAADLFLHDDFLGLRVRAWRDKLEHFQDHFIGAAGFNSAAVEQRLNTPGAADRDCIQPTSALLHLSSDHRPMNIGRWFLAGLFTIAQTLHAFRNNIDVAIAFTKHLEKTCQLASPPRSLTQSILETGLPSFILLQETARHVSQKLLLDCHIDPVDALEFVELTMTLSSAKMNSIVAALSSWLIGSGTLDLVVLDNRVLDDMMNEIQAKTPKTSQKV